MWLRFRLCAVVAVLAATHSLPAQAQSPGSDAQQCAVLNTLADQHEAQAQALLKSIETPAAGMDPAQIAALVEQKSRESSGQSELAGLTREAYRKCLRDYLSGGQAVAPAPLPAPVQQVAPIQQVAPVQQAAPVQQPVQQVQPVQQQQQVYRPPVQQHQQYQQQQQRYQQYQQQVVPGLIELGIGLGLERALRNQNR